MCTSPTELCVGFYLRPEVCDSLVDRGPAPGNEVAIAEWMRLWGSKSETRRFKDGAIVHTVVWESSDAQTVIMQPVRWLLHRHFAVPTSSHFLVGSCGAFGHELVHEPCSLTCALAIRV